MRYVCRVCGDLAPIGLLRHEECAEFEAEQRKELM